MVGAHQILEHHFADAVSTHIAAKPVTPDIGEAGCILVPVKGLQSRPSRCDGSRSEHKIGYRGHQLYWTPSVTDHSHSQADHLVLSAFDLAG